MKAIVKWFDKLSGEGSIRLENGETQFITAAGIPGKKTWFPHTACVFYGNGQEIAVEWDASIEQYRCKTRGHLDKDKWNSLDKDRLAFKCNEAGEAINGLGIKLWD